MQLHHIKLSKKQLDAIPESERTLLILSAHAANELNVLTKIFHFCSTHAAGSDLEKQARNAQAMTIGRLLTGKLLECWKLIEKAFFGAKVSRDYSPEFDGDARKALAELKRYFGRQNLVDAVRNRHAFHYAPNQIAAGYTKLSEEEPLHMYLSATNANTLYAFADVIAGLSLVEDIVPGDVANAFGALISETSRVLGWLNQVVAACMVVAVKRYLGEDLEALESQVIELNGAPDWKSVTIPYFVEIAEKDVT